MLRSLVGSEMCIRDRTPRGATVPRERSYRQLVARQSRPRQENSWRFRVDLAMSVSRLCRLDKGSSRDARRFLRPAMAWECDRRPAMACFCDRPWPGTARCSALSGFLSAIREIIFSILPRRKKSANRVFAKKIIQAIIPSNLQKAKFIRASL